jgi:hypothetical protein
MPLISMLTTSEASPVRPSPEKNVEKMSENVEKMSKNIGKCRKMSENVEKSKKVEKSRKKSKKCVEKMCRKNVSKKCVTCMQLNVFCNLKLLQV